MDVLDLMGGIRSLGVVLRQRRKEPESLSGPTGSLEQAKPGSYSRNGVRQKPIAGAGRAGFIAGLRESC